MEKISNLIDDFNAKEYQEYKSTLKNSKGIEYTESGDIIVLDKKTNERVGFKMPKYVNINNQVGNIREKYFSTLKAYFKTGNDDLLTRLKSYSDEVDILLQYFVLVNDSNKAKTYAIDEEIRAIKLQMRDLTLQPADFVSLQNSLFEKINKKGLLEERPVIDYYIKTLPQRIQVVKQKKEKKMPKKDDEYINIDSVDNNTSSFPFHKLPVKIRNVEECNTRSSSKPYYIGIKDLIKAIEKDDELKKVFGPKYKRLTKKEVCNIMFSK